MAHAVSRRPLIEATRVRPSSSHRQNGTGTGFSPNSSVLPCQYHSATALHTCILSRWWTIGPLLVEIQRRSLIQSTWTTTTFPFTEDGVFSSGFPAEVLCAFLIFRVCSNFTKKVERQFLWNTADLSFHSSYRVAKRGQPKIVVEWLTTPASFLGGPGFKYRPETGFHDWDFFVVFLSPFRRIMGWYLKIRSWPLPFKSFTVHNSLTTLSFDAI
jgi:hypothetical protein